MRYVGMDVHTKYSRICIVDENGEVIEEARLKTTNQALTERFENVDAMTFVLEAGTHSLWVGRLLKRLGHEVVVANPRQVRLIAQSTMKTDRIDALLLARLGRVDVRLVSPVYLRSEDMQAIRSQLKARQVLVKARTSMVNAVRGILKSYGYKLPASDPKYLPRRLNEQELAAHHFELVAPLLEQIEILTARIQQCNKELDERAQKIELVERLKAIAGVGTLTALAFVSAVEEPSRFRASRDVGAYFGLRPKVRRSGDEYNREKTQSMRITKSGDSMVRSLLVQAAHGLLRYGEDSELKQFGMRIKEKKGTQIAATALARKLAVLMHTLWVTEREYEPFYHHGVKSSSAA